MKVLIIKGSSRREGNTGIALSEVAMQLEKNGIATDTTEFTDGSRGRFGSKYKLPTFSD